jgi:hypothetical protein
MERDAILNGLFQAYFDARKNKRNTLQALAFERRFESNLFELCDEIVERRYTPRPSSCFIVDKPVKREIFAADFRDRIVHHFLYNAVSPLFEKRFIHDSYSCRSRRGTSLGIRRLDHFIRSCSMNYSEDCYVLKLDIKGYFMSINRGILFEMVRSRLLADGPGSGLDLPTLLFLLRKTVFNDPTENCRIRGDAADWRGLPADKSLFHARTDCGLPIGNLTSQLFGNVYLDGLDHHVKGDLEIRHYGRYVDDIVIVHRQKDRLRSLIPEIRSYLRTNLQLDLHPGKIHLQHFTKGAKFLGAVIKPHRIYIANRTKGNFFEAIRRFNRMAMDRKSARTLRSAFLSSMNSYLGILRHYKTYSMRTRMISENLSQIWQKEARLKARACRFV